MNIPTRRRLLAAGASLFSLATVLTVGSRRLSAAESGAPDLAAARREGALLLLHGDQEPDVVKFLQLFTERTGIEAGHTGTVGRVGGNAWNGHGEQRGQRECGQAGGDGTDSDHGGGSWAGGGVGRTISP